ncbi:CocE/NonD family hydrolase [Curtobacterium flaccumfaciens]|uniref:CocE/NonD family hydrolase n=1 Tax=Curtobacterium flaccumfaciens TaxID=2035 RepID=UPI003442E1F6
MTSDRGRIRRLARTTALVAAVGAVLFTAGCTDGTDSVRPSSSASLRANPLVQVRPEHRAAFGFETVDDVAITMDDGVVLRATIAYPTTLATGRRSNERFPVVIEHSVYPDTVGFADGPVNTYFAEHGYISVHVNSRGTGGSGGTGGFVSPREAQDGVALIDWAAHDLDGSDGRVAEVGCSWPGMQALADAAAVGPRSPLRAVVAACASLGTVERMDIMVSGVPTGDFGFIRNAADSLMDANRATRDWYHDFSDDVLRGGSPAYQGQFWQDRIPLDAAQTIVDNGVPVLQWTGWDDIVGLGSLRAYTAFQNATVGRDVFAAMTPDQRVSPRYQLVVGPWGHAAGLDLSVALDWLDTWVKGEDTGLQRSRTPLHLHESGSDRWIATAKYPIVTDPTVLRFGQGTLTSERQPAPREQLEWGSATSLSHTGTPLSEPTRLSGPASATILASSSNRNLQLSATLSDVAPDGTSIEITHGSVLGSLRRLDTGRSWTTPTGVPMWPWQSLNEDEFLTPGAMTRYDVALEPRQWRMEAGHRFRLTLSTQAGAELTTPQEQTLPGGRYDIDVERSSLNLPLTTND